MSLNWRWVMELVVSNFSFILHLLLPIVTSSQWRLVKESVVNFSIACNVGLLPTNVRLDRQWWQSFRFIFPHSLSSTDLWWYRQFTFSTKDSDNGGPQNICYFSSVHWCVLGLKVYLALFLPSFLWPKEKSVVCSWEFFFFHLAI